jgi:hypothetical protein
MGPQIRIDQVPAIPSESGTDSKYEVEDFEYEEGLRHQAERNFFKRNPRLVKQAKEVYMAVPAKHAGSVSPRSMGLWD